MQKVLAKLTTNLKQGDKSIYSIEELDGTIKELQSQNADRGPSMIIVTRNNGDSLTMGIGTPILVDEKGEAIDQKPESDFTTLQFMKANGDPPYYSSKGKASNIIPHNFVFFNDGHWSEFHAESAISLPEALDVLHKFLTTERLPKIIDWEVV